MSKVTKKRAGNNALDGMHAEFKTGQVAIALRCLTTPPSDSPAPTFDPIDVIAELFLEVATSHGLLRQAAASVDPAQAAAILTHVDAFVAELRGDGEQGGVL